ncbi:Extra-large guanine nucleotide-binding protein 1 [Citrus sinensis]|uniref:Extra-large guanine nucleotide-binding protein 1 n=1 Tax=Citrus sinensis TaxID=2711 RepID=A0ACB8IJT3_CITSI|nr:Extra-large guanine nucleotide-binding protein 1 [Citrus sinensis]
MEREAVMQRKKSSCYLCLKGNWFTEKEVCIVCDAKYCSNCVLRAMGSMPEGRKCITCTGFRVDDSKRGTLGKCSRMLKRMLTEMEVKQIMRSELSCNANQLMPERVFVNVLEFHCTMINQYSGLTEQIGRRPCQIITPHLRVGGQLMRNASNGNTSVLINNREITKRELCMFQLSGMQCEGQPHFWLSADGSYQEEGMKCIKGCIWDKSRIKLFCSLLSLPTPPDSVNPCGGEVNGVNCCEKKILCKLLLLGEQNSGTSTIYKQVPFSEDERRNIKFTILRNLYRYIGILLEGRERFEEEILSGKGKRQVIDEPGSSGQIDDKTMYTLSPRLKAFSDRLLKVMASNLEAIFPYGTSEYAPFIEELWRDPSFQSTYNRRNELDSLPRVASYFLERVVVISQPDYEPSDMDILYAEGITSTNGLSCMEYSFPESTQNSSIDSSNQNDPLVRYQLIRVDPKCLVENYEWLEMFEDVDLVLFCVSLTCYDEFFEDSRGFLTNKMLASKQLFENIVIHPTFDLKNFLLILNKYNMLEEKIEQVPLTECDWFCDFNPVINMSLAQYASHYVALKFKTLFNSLTGCELFVSIVNALEPETVDEALRYAPVACALIN